MKLDEMFLQAKRIDGALLTTLCTRIFKEHGGLCESYQRFYGKHLADYEIMSFAWEALPIAIAEYDPKLGMASTCWGKIIRRLTVAHYRSTLYVGSVKVSRVNVEQFRATGIESINTSKVDPFWEVDGGIISCDNYIGCNSEV